MCWLKLSAQESGRGRGEWIGLLIAQSIVIVSGLASGIRSQAEDSDDGMLKRLKSRGVSAAVFVVAQGTKGPSDYCLA